MKKLTILVTVGSGAPRITSSEKEPDEGQQSTAATGNEQRQAGTPIQRNHTWNFFWWKTSIIPGSKPKQYSKEPSPNNREKAD